MMRQLLYVRSTAHSVSGRYVDGADAHGDESHVSVLKGRLDDPDPFADAQISKCEIIGAGTEDFAMAFMHKSGFRLLAREEITSEDGTTFMTSPRLLYINPDDPYGFDGEYDPYSTPRDGIEFPITCAVRRVVELVRGIDYINYAARMTQPELSVPPTLTIRTEALEKDEDDEKAADLLFGSKALSTAERAGSIT